MWTSKYLQGCNGVNQCASGYTYSNWQYIDGQGTVHPISSSLQTADSSLSLFGYQTGFQANATDGSGYWIVISNQTNAIVYDLHGDIVYNGTGAEDTNGNLSTQGYDKLGRAYFQLPSGWKVTNKNIYIWTGTGDVDIGGPSGPVQRQVISSLTRPDGRAYTFQYDDAGAPPNSQVGHYGSLTGITLPTGGNIAIQSEWLSQGYYAAVAPYVVQSIHTPDGTWNFDYFSGTPLTVTAPYDPQTGASSQTTCACESGGPSQIISTYAGTASGTPLRQVSVQYSAPGHPSSIATSLNGTVVGTVEYTYPDTCTPRISSKQEYDSGGSLIRETDVQFFTSPSDNAALCSSSGSPSFTDPYLQNGHHIADIPQSVTSYGSSGSNGAIVAQTIYTYDSTTLSTSSGSSGNPVLGLETSGNRPLHDDANFGSSMTVRGNPTVIQRYVSPGQYARTTNYYNVLGELVKTVDPNGNPTQFDYTDTWNDASCLGWATFAYATTITNARGQLTETAYNSCDGSTASTKDQNDISANRGGTVYTYDGLQRTTNISYPDGGNTGIDYGGSAVPEVITTTINASPDPNEGTVATLDGLGRAVSNQTAAATVDTTYDTRGRVYSVSNPYVRKSDPTYGLTTYKYDALNRKIGQTDADSAAEGWTYSGNTVTFTDEDGNQWERLTDGAGRLSEVLEPTGTSKSPTLETDYQYDALDDLTRVDQWGGTGSSGDRVRTFVFDGLGHLTSATNPESGTTTYTYDANGNVLTKTSPAVNATSGIQTISFGYDALNRLCYKVYGGSGADLQACPSQPPTNTIAAYGYDVTSLAGASNTIGRLTDARSYAGNTMVSERQPYSYDAMGRLLIERRCLVDNCSQATFQPAYTYDLAGNLHTFTDGITRSPTQPPGTLLTFTNAYDSGGRLETVTSNWSDGWHPSTLFQTQSGPPSPPCGSSATGPYAGFGGLMNATLGSTTYGTGLALNRNYDNRLRTNCEIDQNSGNAAATSGSGTVTIIGAEQTK